MLNLAIGLIIGIIIGWNWPQPDWAKNIQTRLVSFVRPSSSKDDNK